MIHPLLVGFVLLGVDTTLGDGCEMDVKLTQFHGSEMSPGLFQDFIDEYIKP